MALPIRKLLPSEIELANTPYLADIKGYWVDGLKLFHRAIASYFTLDKIYGDFELAERLNVHRTISDEWLAGLVSLGLAERTGIPISRVLSDPAEASGFILNAPIMNHQVKLTIPAPLYSYDPWIDRDWDLELEGARMPDIYVDKFYMVAVDEHYIIRRKRRRREDGSLFIPVAIPEQPRYATSHQTRTYEKSIPPIEWRGLIDKAASETEDDDT